MTEPTTAAGRALLAARHVTFPMEARNAVRDAILAIEAEAHEQGMLRQLERQIHDEQQDGSALPSVETLTAWLREDYAAEAATSGGNPFSTRRPDEFVATRIRSRLAALLPSAPPALDCTHAEGCICVEIAHTPCCGTLREKVLANTGYDAAAGPTTQQVADSRFLEHERALPPGAPPAERSDG